MSKIFSIEGNIGAGKSTILEYVQTMAPEYLICPEPLDEWAELKTDNGDTLLEAFYKDQKTHAFTFQISVLVSRYKQLQTNRHLFPNRVLIQERSFLGDFDTFVSTLASYGYFTRAQLQVYLNVFNLFKKQTPAPIFFFVDTPSEVCLERIGQRGRSGEEHITLSYLQDLRSGIYLLLSGFPDRVYILDGMKTPRELASEMVEIIKIKNNHL